MKRSMPRVVMTTSSPLTKSETGTQNLNQIPKAVQPAAEESVEPSCSLVFSLEPDHEFVTPDSTPSPSECEPPHSRIFPSPQDNLWTWMQKAPFLVSSLSQPGKWGGYLNGITHDL